MITKRFQDALDEACPMRRIKVSSCIRHNTAPYMMETLLNSRKKLSKLAKLAKNKPNDLSNETPGKTNWGIFNDYKKLYAKTRRGAKRKYFNETFAEIKHKSKECWQLINSLLKKKNTNNDIQEIIFENKSCKSNIEISNAFNKFYSNVGRTQAKTIPECDKDPMAFLKGLPPESMFLMPCTEEELRC